MAAVAAAGSPVGAADSSEAGAAAGSRGGDRYEAELWASHSAFPGRGQSVTVSPDGAFVYATGFRGPHIGHAYSTVAYEAATGAERWAAFYNPADGPGEFDSAAEVVVTPDGTKVVVTGFSYLSCCSSDVATVAYDAGTGARLWAARHDSGGGTYDGGTSIAVSPDSSTVVVTGYRGDGVGFCTDMSTLAYDTATGARRWKARYDGPGHHCDAGRAVRVTPDGRTAVVTGYSVGSGTNYDYATVAYDTGTGTQRWAARYTRSDGIELADALAVTADGATVVVTGTSRGSLPGTGEDYATVAYDTATGTERWAARYDGAAHGDDLPSAVAVAPDTPSVVVTGSSAGPWGYDYATVTYDTATGARRWVDRYNGPVDEDDLAHAAVVTPDGEMAVVTGSSEGRTGSNYATAFYDLGTGNRFLVARYNQVGLSADAAYSVAISPDSTTAFVTGTSVAADGRLHVGTVAYPT